MVLYPNTKMTDVMVDIETLSTRPNAVILTIGAILFNRNNDIKPLDRYKTYYERITIDSCLDLGMDLDADTQKWWEKQPYKSRYDALINPDRMALKDALQKFSMFFGSATYMWSNGASFDPVILTEAYRKCGMDTPWKFWNIRDTRTLYDLGHYRLPSICAHNALEDSYAQLAGLYIALNTIKDVKA